MGQVTADIDKIAQFLIKGNGTMEFTSFPVHARGIIIRMLVAHLDLGQDVFKDTPVGLQDFFADKAKYGGRFAQLPALKMENGYIMTQNNAVCRFLAKSYRGKDGTCFYPGAADPMLTYQIDQWVDQQDPRFAEIIPFTVPFLDSYKTGKEDHFVAYITEKLPAHLQKLEDHFTKNKTKYLCADHPTLADFSMGTHIIRLAYNHKYEYEHIVRAVVMNYPLTQAWIERFRDYISPWWTTEGNNWTLGAF